MMTTSVATEPSAAQRRFNWVAAQLTEARRRQMVKDTPANRMAVSLCKDMVDAVLDEYLEATGRAGALG
jgi:hypothetical protein